MPSKVVLAEIDTHGDPIRIFRTVKAACKLPVEHVAEFPKALAVSVIRRKVFERAAGSCEYCGNPITPKTGHMHEELPKGKGGEVSVENGRAICYDCHLGPNGAHGNRRWHTSKISKGQ